MTRLMMEASASAGEPALDTLGRLVVGGDIVLIDLAFVFDVFVLVESDHVRLCTAMESTVVMIEMLCFDFDFGFDFDFEPDSDFELCFGFDFDFDFGVALE